MDELTVCPKCGKRTERYIELPLFDGTNNKRKIKVHVMCPCEQAELIAYEENLRKEEEIRDISLLKQVSLMDSKLRGARLKTLKICMSEIKAYGVMALSGAERVMQQQ